MRQWKLGFALCLLTVSLIPAGASSTSKVNKKASTPNAMGGSDWRIVDVNGAAPDRRIIFIDKSSIKLQGKLKIVTAVRYKEDVDAAEDDIKYTVYKVAYDCNTQGFQEMWADDFNAAGRQLGEISVNRQPITAPLQPNDDDDLSWGSDVESKAVCGGFRGNPRHEAAATLDTLVGRALADLSSQGALMSTAASTAMSPASTPPTVTTIMLCDSKYVDTSSVDGSAPSTKTGSKRRAHRFEANGANFSTYDPGKSVWNKVGANQIEITGSGASFGLSTYTRIQYAGQPRLAYTAWNMMFDLSGGQYSYHEKRQLLASNNPPPGSVKAGTSTALRAPRSLEIGAEHYVFIERRTGSCKRVSEAYLADALKTGRSLTPIKR